MAIASSRSAASKAASTGPKSSSRATVASSGTSASTVGVKNQPRAKRGSAGGAGPPQTMRAPPPPPPKAAATASATQRRRRICDRPQRQLLDLRPQAGEEGLGDLPRHHHPAGRRALLPREAHGAAGGQRRRQVEVGVGEDGGHLLAPHLG